MPHHNLQLKQDFTSYIYQPWNKRQNWKFILSILEMFVFYGERPYNILFHFILTQISCNLTAAEKIRYISKICMDMKYAFIFEYKWSEIEKLQIFVCDKFLLFLYLLCLLYKNSRLNIRVSHFAQTVSNIQSLAICQYYFKFCTWPARIYCIRLSNKLSDTLSSKFNYFCHKNELPKLMFDIF